jgi:adenine-specific DNA-methyltransferase
MQDEDPICPPGCPSCDSFRSQAARGMSETIEVLRIGKRKAQAEANRFLQHDERVLFARMFCASIVQAFWSNVLRFDKSPWALPELFVSVTGLPSNSKLNPMATNMGSTAGALDLQEASYFIGSIYTSLLPDKQRSEWGAYYTPPPLVRRLLDTATQAGLDWRTCSVCDPACGGGAFLVPIAARIIAENRRVPSKVLVRSLSERVRGWEIDPFAAWLAQVFLELSAIDVCRRANERLPILVEVTDSLGRKDVERMFDLVIGNPPYGRLTLQPEMRRQYQRSLYGHANLYGLFTDLAVRLTRPGGIVAYVTPTSFLAGEYFKSLRGLLATEARPVNVDFVSVRKGVFEDVLQETLLATYRCGGQNPRAFVHFISPADDGGIAVNAAGRFSIPKQPGSPWLIPRSSSEGKLVTLLRTFKDRLQHYGYAVSTGPLVWNRHKGQLRRRLSPEVLPLIWAESVSTDGEFRFRSLKKNHQPYFAPMHGDDWLISRHSCVLVQRTTAKEQRRRLIAAELPQGFIQRHTGVVIENHLNMIKPITSQPAVPPSVLANLLNSSIVDRAFRCVSGSVAVSAYELESLPLPPIERVLPLTGLLHQGANRNAIDEFCSEIFA